MAYIRGPFIAEGLLQGGFGALVAVLLLLGAFAAIRPRVGPALSETLGLTGVAFVPVELLVLLVVGGMLLGRSADSSWHGVSAEPFTFR